MTKQPRVAQYLDGGPRTASYLDGGKTDHELLIERALGAVADMAAYYGRGDGVLGEQARQTLDALCWSPDGYPEPVRQALVAAGLRSTAK
jgi:hypothetical protein